MTGRLYENSQIISNVPIAPDVYMMTVQVPEMAENVRAGQFAMLYIDKGELILPRPISFCDVNLSRGTVQFVYKVVGAGTDALSKLHAWNNISVLGPLGNGYHTKGRNDERFSKVALVGGGIGIPPLHLLAKSLVTNGTYADIYLGFSASPILVERFRHLASRLHVTTENGSYGHSGNIIDLLSTYDMEYDEIFACGPRAMLMTLVEFGRKKGIPCQVSLEERMACGLGACVGCSIRVKDTYVRVCTEGPVFYDNEVELHG